MRVRLQGKANEEFEVLGFRSVAEGLGVPVLNPETLNLDCV